MSARVRLAWRRIDGDRIDCAAFLKNMTSYRQYRTLVSLLAGIRACRLQFFSGVGGKAGTGLVVKVEGGDAARGQFFGLFAKAHHGGNLALVTLLEAQRRDLELPAAAWAISPGVANVRSSG